MHALNCPRTLWLTALCSQTEEMSQKTGCVVLDTEPSGRAEPWPGPPSSAMWLS